MVTLPTPIMVVPVPISGPGRGNGAAGPSDAGVGLKARSAWSPRSQIRDPGHPDAPEDCRCSSFSYEAEDPPAARACKGWAFREAPIAFKERVVCVRKHALGG